VTHPDGRLQRVRPSAGRAGDIRPNIAVLSELASKLGLDTGINSQPTAFAALTEAVSFYRGISDSDIGGRGTRWQDNSPELHQLHHPADSEVDAVRGSGSMSRSDGALTLGTYRDLWAGPITELNPPLKFLTPQQRVEVSLADAERLGLKTGETIRVSHGGTTVEAQVQIKDRVPAGVVFMAEGVAGGNANALLNGGLVKVEITKLSEVRA